MKLHIRTMAPALLLLSTALPMPGFACSICRCGDPTFNALGKEGIAQSGLRLAFDWDRLEKTQGNPSEDVDAITERRETLLAAYGFSPAFSLFARLPYSHRDLTETGEGEAEMQSASGFADPEIYGQLRLWSSDMEGDVGVRNSLYLVGGVKTDWGENNISEAGERLDEHVQPGTGSTDWFVGLSASHQINPLSAMFASVSYRATGRNDYGYKYGDVTLLNLAYERKLSARWDGTVELNYRNAGYDQIDDAGERDPNTGGSITYFTPHVLFDAGHGWVLRASAQIPISQSGLNGYQDESTVWNLGITKVYLE